MVVAAAEVLTGTIETSIAAQTTLMMLNNKRQKRT
jgi:hypothetical protein